MNNTTTSLTPYTLDLETQSRGSSGHRLMSLLGSLDLETLGATSPVDLARRLQVESHEIDTLVGRYLETAVIHRELVSLVMVAIQPRLDVVTRRNVGYAPSREFREELVLTLLEFLGDVGHQPVSFRREWLAATAVNSARARVRRERKGNFPTGPLDPEFDVEEPEEENALVLHRLDAMWAGVRLEVISIPDFALIDCTRVWGTSLSDLAEVLPASYDALRMRRSRAERRLRQFIENPATEVVR